MSKNVGIGLQDLSGRPRRVHTLNRDVSVESVVRSSVEDSVGTTTVGRPRSPTFVGRSESSIAPLNRVAFEREEDREKEVVRVREVSM